ncbi:MAG: hypothetical protein ACRCUE_17775 [Bosea sp. (in: a-proteobacteria)]
MSETVHHLLNLPERPQARDMAAFRTTALDLFERGQPVSINAGNAGQLPLAWMQLLIATAREARLRSTSVTIINPTFGFLFSFEALGLQPEQDLFTLEFAL